MKTAWKNICITEKRIFENSKKTSDYMSSNTECNSVTYFT